VELGGFEPPASSVRRKRAPSAPQPRQTNGDYCNEEKPTCQASNTEIIYGFKINDQEKVISVSSGPELFKALSKALSETLFPARIGKIETGDSWAAFRVTRKGNWLLFSWNPRSYGCGIVDDPMISFLKKTRTGKSSFGEALKSNFLNGSFISVKQLNNDRVLVFRAERMVGAGFPVHVRLVFEGTERNSNLLILDSVGTILEPAKHIHGDMNRYRMLLPGISYTPPPPLKGREWEAGQYIRSAGELSNLTGIGKGLAKNIASLWDEKSSGYWAGCLSSLLDENAPVSGLVLQKIGTYLTIFPDLLPGAESVPGGILEGAGQEIISAAFSDHREHTLAKVRKMVSKEIRSRIRHADGLRNQAAMAEKADEFRKSGDLILAAKDSIPPRAKEVILTDWETGEEVRIQLDEKLSPSQNAEKYFRKYKKGKIDVNETKGRILSLEEGIQELEEQLEALESIDDPDLLAAAAADILDWVSPEKKRLGKKKKESTPPHIQFQNGEDLIYVGLNARGNRYVTFRCASPTDLWFHVHEIPGAHVILKTPGRGMSPRDDSIEIAASLAAWYSRAKNAAKVQVDYTEKKNVRSIPGSAIAHVTYTSPRTLQISPGLWKEHPEAALSRRQEGSK
jgi:predicted ribosome quality control (RQC) complex YloA/Tae2 family protein